MKVRGFEKITKYAAVEFSMPERKTQKSAGYDICLPEDIELLPGKLQLVPTGIKAYMQDDEFLMLANRSSNPLKRRLVLPNGVGIVDSDYYDNSGNEGEIFFQLLNFGLKDVVIKKGERIGQGIFMPYLQIDDEDKPLAERKGGFGSSGR